MVHAVPVTDLVKTAEKVIQHLQSSSCVTVFVTVCVSVYEYLMVLLDCWVGR